jgi:hypothetical protein
MLKLWENVTGINTCQCTCQIRYFCVKGDFLFHIAYFHFILFSFSILFFIILYYLFNLIVFCFILYDLFDFILFYFISLFYFILFYFILFYFISFNLILFYFILFYFLLFFIIILHYFILFVGDDWKVRLWSVLHIYSSLAHSHACRTWSHNNMATHWSLHDVTEGWSKWQIALCVGAPIAIGLAGVWYYTRRKSKSDTPDVSPSPRKAQTTPETPQVRWPVLRTEVKLEFVIAQWTACYLYCFNVYWDIFSQKVWSCSECIRESVCLGVCLAGFVRFHFNLFTRPRTGSRPGAHRVGLFNPFGHGMF